jgi:hypothetical protein
VSREDNQFFLMTSAHSCRRQDLVNGSFAVGGVDRVRLRDDSTPS